MGGTGKVSGVIEAVNWKESAEELHARYETERDVEARKRLGALWLVRRGESVGNAAESMGVSSRRTLTRWLSWYRRGGLEEVLSRVPGHGALGSECRLKEWHSKGSCSRGRARGSFAPTRKRGDGSNNSGGSSTVTRGCMRC